MIFNWLQKEDMEKERLTELTEDLYHKYTGQFSPPSPRWVGSGNDLASSLREQNKGK